VCARILMEIYARLRILMWIYARLRAPDPSSGT